MTELGKITPKRMYQTTDGVKHEDRDTALSHQRVINYVKSVIKESRIPEDVKDLFHLRYSEKDYYNLPIDAVIRLQCVKGTVIIDVNFTQSTMDVTVETSSMLKFYTTMSHFKKLATVHKKVKYKHGKEKRTVHAFRF